jgi:hypothetical protein
MSQLGHLADIASALRISPLPPKADSRVNDYSAGPFSDVLAASVSLSYWARLSENRVTVRLSEALEVAIKCSPECSLKELSAKSYNINTKKGISKHGKTR